MMVNAINQLVSVLKRDDATAASCSTSRSHCGPAGDFGCDVAGRARRQDDG